MDGETVNVGGNQPTPTPGTAGVQTQVPGQAATVSAVADATGGIGAGNLVESDLDQELYKFKSDDTPLMQLMLKARKVKVKSPEVDHYMIDEPRSSITTISAVNAGSAQQFVLPLGANDADIPRPYGTLLVKGVDGYLEDGKTRTPGKDLMLFVTGQDPTSNNPIVRATNGPRESTGEYCTTPAIPAGTTLIILSNALYETQKDVDPDLIVPQPTTVYLQKRGMNRVVSDYYDAQKKRIPFGKAVIAEAAITNFKVRGNRTLYAGRKGKINVNVPKLGTQSIYFTEGVRYQVKKELQHVGKWTVEEIIALAKMVFTGEDIPKSVIALAGKNFLENIQCIDYSKHPEIQITTKTDKTVGWEVTNFHTLFGDFEFKHDPTLDRLKWSNSAFIVAPDRLVHYQYSAEHTSTDRIEGEEATRESVLVWDALALKGSCHVWINGEATTADGNINTDAVHYHLYDGTDAPENPAEGYVYYMINDCPGISNEAVKGTLWQYKDGKWVEFVGEVMATE